MVEHTTHNRAVAGSNPATATNAPLKLARLPAGRLLVAVSGGPDSTALLFALGEQKRDLVAAHYDHALREGSSQDACHVAELCESLGIRLITRRRDRPMPAGSVQAAARHLRYEFLEQAAEVANAGHVVLGHTADDVVEGALMHLERGSGLAGLRGMPASRGRYRRPLLGTWREEIEAFLAARGLVPLRDPSNLDTERFARARVRHEVLPQLEATRPGIKRSIHGAAVAAGRLQARAEREAALLTGDRPQLRNAPRAVRFELYRRLFGEQPALDRRQLEEIDRLALAGRTGSGLDLPRGRRFRVSPDAVSIDVDAERTTPPAHELQIHPCEGCKDPDAAHFPSTARLSLGHRTPGLTLRPWPSGRTRKLQDVLVDAKLPRHRRDGYPLVFADGRLAWVPGIARDALLTNPTAAPGMHVKVAEGRNGRW